MPRHRKDYSGERRTAFVGFQVTPSERAGLEEAAKEAGTTLSQLSRELCFRRLPTTGPRSDGVRRDPQLRVLLGELHAIGVNLNQLTRLSNTTHSPPQLEELKDTTDALKATFARVLDL